MKPTWERDGIQLYLGDCFEVLPTLGKVDAVVTDPPYGIAFESHGHWFKDSSAILGDKSVEVGEKVVKHFIDEGVPIAAFCSPYKMWSGKFRNWLAWDKGEHVGIGGDRETCWKRTIEMIGVTNNRPLNGKRDGAALRFNAVSPPPSGHFCEKPIPLMCYLVEKLTNPGDVVFDPFMGSAATGEACVKLGRQFIGCEVEDRWFDYSIKRIERALSEEWSSLFPVAKEEGLRQTYMYDREVAE